MLPGREQNQSVQHKCNFEIQHFTCKKTPMFYNKLLTQDLNPYHKPLENKLEVTELNKSQTNDVIKIPGNQKMKQKTRAY